MAPTLVREPFHRDGWIYEEKVDGWRILAYKDGGHVRLVSRHGVDHTKRFPHIAAAVAKLRPARLVLDGEVAVFDEDLVSQFFLLHDTEPAITCTPPVLMAFDCLRIADRGLCPLPLHERRRTLEAAVAGAELILPVRRLPADGLEAWKLVKERGYEGLVAKDGASSYQAGESRSWKKIKVRQDGQFLVGGIGEIADGSPRLFIGEDVNGRLVYRGTVDLGVGRALVELLRRGRQRPTPPFEGLRFRRVTWLEPTVAIEVSYGRLQQGWLREPACRGLADDIGSARRDSRARSDTPK